MGDLTWQDGKPRVAGTFWLRWSTGAETLGRVSERSGALWAPHGKMEEALIVAWAHVATPEEVAALTKRAECCYCGVAAGPADLICPDCDRAEDVRQRDAANARAEAAEAKNSDYMASGAYAGFVAERQAREKAEAENKRLRLVERAARVWYAARDGDQYVATEKLGQLADAVGGLDAEDTT